MSVTGSLLLFIVLVKFSYSEYKGEDFPENYLTVDGNVPTDSDMSLYLDRAVKLTNYLMREPNETDINQALASFMSGALLKRALLDYGDRLPTHRDTIKGIALKLSRVVSHYIYLQRNKPVRNLERLMSKVIRDDSSHVHSIGALRSGALSKWLTRHAPINEHVADMDRLTLAKRDYVKLVQHVADDKYSLTGYDSDYCLSRLVKNMDPVNLTALRPCWEDERCKNKIFLSPSIAYTMSHRQFNNMMYLHNRRCFHHSPSFDYSHIEMLCANMYREMVYLARRGYFARDVFMEHLGLCGQMGYEEVHRRHWFRKVASWIDDEGCMQEFQNFDINRTMLTLEETTDPKEKRMFKRMLRDSLEDDCHHHHMAVALMVFANAVRHAAHHAAHPPAHHG